MQWGHSLLGLVDTFDFLPSTVLCVCSFTLTILCRSNRPINETQPAEVVRRCGLCNASDMLLKRRPVKCLPVPLFISSGSWDMSHYAHVWALLFFFQTGGFMVGCGGYPLCRNVVWLPGSLAEAAVTQHICPTCVPGGHLVPHLLILR
jgi:DNA topoisomerase-3